MKLSKLLHVISVITGLIGIITFAATIIVGPNKLLFGITRTDALLCAGVLVLIAIWVQIATIHHMILEKRGEII